MELLIIRHAESRRNMGVTYNLDSTITDEGMSQACRTAAWLYENFKFEGYKGLVSPYHRTLQTASVLSEVLETEFCIDDRLAEYRFQNPDVVNIPNRSLLFQNIGWPNDWLDEKERPFAPEAIDLFIDRSLELLLDLKKSGHDKYILVTHGAPSVMLSKLAIGNTREEIKQECERANKILESHEVKDFLEEVAKQSSAFISGMKNCGMTWIVEEEPMWFSKVVYK
jgi:broad specificity phosphatase PhoE